MCGRGGIGRRAALRSLFFNRSGSSSLLGPSGKHCLSAQDEAAEYAKRLGYVLEASWNNTTRIRPVDVATIIDSFKPKSVLLSEMAEEYLALREIDQAPPRSALSTFISLAGDRDVGTYTREDAKLFVHHLQWRGNKTAIRRRINSLSAILNYAYAELDLDKRNPFTRLIIRNEGQDVIQERYLYE